MVGADGHGRSAGYDLAARSEGVGSPSIGCDRRWVGDGGRGRGRRRARRHVRPARHVRHVAAWTEDRRRVHHRAVQYRDAVPHRRDGRPGGPRRDPVPRRAHVVAGAAPSSTCRRVRWDRRRHPRHQPGRTRLHASRAASARGGDVHRAPGALRRDDEHGRRAAAARGLEVQPIQGLGPRADPLARDRCLWTPRDRSARAAVRRVGVASVVARGQVPRAVDGHRLDRQSDPPRGHRAGTVGLVEDIDQVL